MKVHEEIRVQETKECIICFLIQLHGCGLITIIVPIVCSFKCEKKGGQKNLPQTEESLRTAHMRLWR